MNFDKGRLTNILWKNDQCASCQGKNTTFVCLNGEQCAVKSSLCNTGDLKTRVDCSLTIQLTFSGTDKYQDSLNSWYQLQKLQQYSLFALYSNLKRQLQNQFHLHFWSGWNDVMHHRCIWQHVTLDLGPEDPSDFLVSEHSRECFLQVQVFSMAHKIPNHVCGCKDTLPICTSDFGSFQIFRWYDATYLDWPEINAPVFWYSKFIWLSWFYSFEVLFLFFSTSSRKVYVVQCEDDPFCF